MFFPSQILAPLPTISRQAGEAPFGGQTGQGLKLPTFGAHPPPCLLPPVSTSGGMWALTAGEQGSPPSYTVPWAHRSAPALVGLTSWARQAVGQEESEETQNPGRKQTWWGSELWV